MEFIEDSMAYNILIVLAVCGEFPFHSLHMIPGNHEWLLKVLIQLKKERYVSVTGNGQLKSIRLLKKGLQTVKDLKPEFLQQYKLVTGDKYPLSGDETHRARNHRTAEAILLCLLAGALVLVFAKPPLRKERSDDVTRIKQTLFYTSKELKQVKPDEIKKTEFTRMIGAFTCPNGTFGVYNVGNHIIRWTPKWEIKAWNLLYNIGWANGWGTSSSDLLLKKRVLILAKTPMIAAEIIRDRKPREKNFFQLDDSFLNAYFVPLNESGVKMLQLLMIPDFDKSIRNYMLPADMRDDYYTMDIDGWDGKTRTGYYLFFDSDLMRLKRMVSFFSTDNELERDIHIVAACFPWQEELLRHCFPDEVTIKVFEMEDLIEKVFR